MKISHKWLLDYINTTLSPDEIAAFLTDTGLEVEGVQEIESIPGGLKGVVIGEVLTCEQHPNADKLKLTTVNIGAAKDLQIVCGAPNVAKGQKVPVATIGTVIHSDESNFTIKKGKLRGEISEGMICAEDELNLGEGHDGIMVLSDDAVPGTPAAEYFNIESDFVYEIGLTPNRTDAMCHYGVARDLRAALLRHGHEGVNINMPYAEALKSENNSLPIKIEIENTEACGRYTGLSISGVKVGPSPDWLQNRLRTIGLGPINNIVDVTNYVLHETGHPLHAFDADEITGQKIIVKNMPKGTKFITLDDKERSLHEEDLMICNEEEPMVLAGVFGGKKSGVTSKTKRVFLEAAYFNPVHIRKTAKRHGLNTDASFRYERGVDPEMTLYALKRAALLIMEVAGGEISMPIADEHPVKIEPISVELSLQNMEKLIGQAIEEEMVLDILRWLEIKVISKNGDRLGLQVPSYRADVTREVDIIEEILRIYGFNAIDFGEQMRLSVAPHDPKSNLAYTEMISNALSSRGFNEIMNNSLTQASYFNSLGFDVSASIEMLNPLSQDLGVMRQSLLFGGLESLSRNSNRQRGDLKLYEFGSVYQKQDKAYKEEQLLGIWVSGNERAENWREGVLKSDFYTLKKEVDFVLKRLGLSDLLIEDAAAKHLEYGVNYVLNKRNVVTLGKVSTDACKQTNFKGEAFFAQFDWSYLTAKAKKKKVQFAELPKYPEVRRDLALLLDKEVKYQDLETAAHKAERKLLKNVNLFDVYEGKNLANGKKSYAMSFVLADEKATLNDKQVDKVVDKILNSFKAQFQAELR
jgi:phenylalanyl-tRNA synthetase beta chain